MVTVVLVRKPKPKGNPIMQRAMTSRADLLRFDWCWNLLTSHISGFFFLLKNTDEGLIRWVFCYSNFISSKEKRFLAIKFDVWLKIVYYWCVLIQVVILIICFFVNRVACKQKLISFEQQWKMVVCKNISNFQVQIRTRG